MNELNEKCNVILFHTFIIYHPIVIIIIFSWHIRNKKKKMCACQPNMMGKIYILYEYTQNLYTFIYLTTTRKKTQIYVAQKNIFLLLVCKKVVMLIARSARCLSLKYKIYEGMGSLVLYIVYTGKYINERIFAATYIMWRHENLLHCRVMQLTLEYIRMACVSTYKYTNIHVYIHQTMGKTCIEKA